MWHAVRYLRIVMLLVALVAVGVLVGGKSLTQKAGLEQKKSSIRKENCKLALEIKDLERQVTLMRSDPHTIEKVVKRKLGMVRPNEMVYIFGQESPTALRANNIVSTLKNKANIP
ncbi:MAG: septum formation initiator family protein [Desulfomonilaceae bacterium]